MLPSQEMCDLLIAGEDHRFYRHCGVDIIALCRAVVMTLFHGSRQGGSTIAMQLVRTITQDFRPTIFRKIAEIFLSVKLTRYLGKERIPLLYLYIAYYGWRMNNFNEACSRLNINASKMDTLQAAMLVARLKYPQPRHSNSKRNSQIQQRSQHLVSLLTAKRRASLSPSERTICDNFKCLPHLTD